MGLLTFLLFGLLVGFVARALFPGEQKMGCLATALLGCGGSFVGGVLGNLLLGRGMWTLSTAGFVGSVIGAILILFLLRKRFER